MAQFEDIPEQPDSGLQFHPAGRDPAEVRDNSDPGDATVRNFRYQHAYGVMLLVAARRGHRAYAALWCEHHEDFLAERTDNRYDGYQIKTSRPELGAWTLADAELIASIGRFVELVSEFPDRIANLFFVSNTECDHVTQQSKNEKKRGNCPRLFLEHVKACKALSEIEAPFLSVFNNLQAQCGCRPSDLFAVLVRMDIILGPSRSDFEAALSHEHIAKLDGCQLLTAEQLDQFRDDLVAKVYRASSLQVGDPSRHLRPQLSKDPDPTLLAKRLVVDEIVTYQSAPPQLFQFQGNPTLTLGASRSPTVLAQKLEKGGLVDEIEYLRERERVAEYSLMEDVARRPDQYPKLLRQVEQLVLGECSEAHLRARQQEAPYGPIMMIEVQDRLRRIATDNSDIVGNHSYECLIGVAGMLTSDCRVWWSPRFPIAESDA